MIFSVENDCGEKNFIVLNSEKSLKEFDEEHKEETLEKQNSLKTIGSAESQGKKNENWFNSNLAT